MSQNKSVAMYNERTRKHLNKTRAKTTIGTALSFLSLEGKAESRNSILNCSSHATFNVSTTKMSRGVDISQAFSKLEEKVNKWAATTDTGVDSKTKRSLWREFYDLKYELAEANQDQVS